MAALIIQLSVGLHVIFSHSLQKPGAFIEAAIQLQKIHTFSELRTRVVRVVSILFFITVELNEFMGNA